MAQQDKNNTIIDGLDNTDTVIPAIPPSESTEADIRAERYKRVHRYASEIFARDFDMNAVMGRLGFGWKENS